LPLDKDARRCGARRLRCRRLRRTRRAAIMRSVNVVLAFPYLLLAMIVVAILGPSRTNAMIAIGIVYTPQVARLVRGAVLGFSLVGDGLRDLLDPRLRGRS